MSSQSENDQFVPPFQPNPDELKAIVRHDGDCCCYGIDSEGICDCGALRTAIRAGEASKNDKLWEVWANHQRLTSHTTLDLATLQRRAEEAEALLVNWQNHIAEIVGHSPALSSPVSSSVAKMRDSLTTAQKQIAEKDEALRGLIGWVRAVRHSMDANLPFPSAEKLTERIESAERVIGSDGSEFVHKSEVEKAQRDPEMPGAWRCPKCNFTLQKNVLYTGSGTMLADTSPLNEVCPNDGQLMRPLTWRETNEELYKMACDQLQELTTLKQKVEKLTDPVTYLKAYDSLLKQHVYYKKFIDGTPFANDAAVIGWRTNDAIAREIRL